MNRITLPITAICLVLGTSSAFAEDRGVSSLGAKNEYVRLLNASKFIENYKEMASVSARVFAARAQGSDKGYARFMKVVSTADLSDIDGCLVKLYANQGVTSADADEVSSFYESPLGAKVLRLSQQMLIGDLERGYHAPPPANSFTADEQQKIIDAYQSPALSHYNRKIASRDFGLGVSKCLATSKAVKQSGIKF